MFVCSDADSVVRVGGVGGGAGGPVHHVYRLRLSTPFCCDCQRPTVLFGKYVSLLVLFVSEKQE